MLILNPIRQSVVRSERKRPLPPAAKRREAGRFNSAISGAGRMRETRLQLLGRRDPSSPRSAGLFEMRDASRWAWRFLLRACAAALAASAGLRSPLASVPYVNIYTSERQ
jgi:hypothetical protein